MKKEYDYCDTYDSYKTGVELNNKNEIKIFSCSSCKKSTLILKKSISDKNFKCEDCIESFFNGNHVEQKQVYQQEENQESVWKWFNFFW